jgi:preprotein translocase subunit SecG
VINFRYHVVSLTAVFLALAIGLVVGTAALNGPVADSLKENVNALRKDNQQMRQAVNSMEKDRARGGLRGRMAQVVLLQAERQAGAGAQPSTGRDYTDGVPRC